MIAQAKRLTKSKFARNVAIVASGTAGAQAITMAFSPIITRLYGPEAFGVLGTFTAILAVLTPLAALSYPIAIVLPRRDADALGLAKLSLGIALAMSLLAALILTLFKTPIVNAFNLEAVESFILLLPLAMLFTAAMAVMSQWVIRKKLFTIKAKVAVLQALWLNTAKVGIGLFSPLAAVLMVLATVGSALHAIMLWASLHRISKSPLTESGRSVASGSRELAWQYRDFAYYRTPQAFIYATTQSIPVLMLASFFGPSETGYYALAIMVLGAPSHLIGQSLAEVFYPKFVELRRAGENGKRLIISSLKTLFAVGFIPYLVIVVAGKFVFKFVFGADWATAGVFSQWISVWLLVMLVIRPVITVIPVLGLQKEFLAFEIFKMVSVVLAITSGYVIFTSALLSVALFCMVNAVAYCLLAYYVVSKV